MSENTKSARGFDSETLRLQAWARKLEVEIVRVKNAKQSGGLKAHEIQTTVYTEDYLELAEFALKGIRASIPPPAEKAGNACDPRDLLPDDLIREALLCYHQKSSGFSSFWEKYGKRPDDVVAEAAKYWVSIPPPAENPAHGEAVIYGGTSDSHIARPDSGTAINIKGCRAASESSASRLGDLDKALTLSSQSRTPHGEAVRALEELERIGLTMHCQAFQPPSHPKDLEAALKNIGYWSERLHHIWKALTTPAVSVPSGYKLVPVEPTEEMMAAMYDCKPPATPGTLYYDGYKAMLAAAPTPSASPTQGEWRGIESAPKNWSTVLLYVPESYEPAVDDLNGGDCEAYVTSGYYSCADGGHDCWMDYNKKINPTHWQPLPPPPSADGE